MVNRITAPDVTNMSNEDMLSYVCVAVIGLFVIISKPENTASFFSHPAVKGLLFFVVAAVVYSDIKIGVLFGIAVTLTIVYSHVMAAKREENFVDNETQQKKTRQLQQDMDMDMGMDMDMDMDMGITQEATEEEEADMPDDTVTAQKAASAQEEATAAQKAVTAQEEATAAQEEATAAQEEATAAQEEATAARQAEATGGATKAVAASQTNYETFAPYYT